MLAGVRIFVGIISAIIFVVGLLALIIWNGAYLFRGPAAPDNQAGETDKRNKAVLLSLGIAVGIEIACGIDEKPDRDLAMSFGRSLGSETVHAFVVGVGGGLDIRNDRNYPAVCSSTDILMKVQWARNAARL